MGRKKVIDFNEVKGQEHVKRGLEVATAGGHNVILIGPPHAGKKMMAERVPTIEPLPCVPATHIKIKKMLPCPCGYFTDPKKECTCTPSKIQAYLTKCVDVLGLAECDIHLEVPRLNLEHLTNKRAGEPSSDIQARTLRASIIQAERQGKPNASLTGADLEKFCVLDKEAEDLLKLAILKLGISARAYDKILRVSRTIADLDDGKDLIEVHHISEAISYRSLDRNLGG